MTDETTTRPPRIDALQYCAWSEEIFGEMREGGVDAVHATVAYHGGFREAAFEIAAWNRRFQHHADKIRRAHSGADIAAAQAEGRTAILLGFQNPSVIEDDLGLVEILHQMGVRVLQLTYNNQSLLGTGHAEREDSGLTNMGREVIGEMNRLGMVIDLSHAGPRTTLEAIEASAQPIAVTHANPRSWHDISRNVPDEVIAALAETGGMLGFSLYPLHLAGGSACSFESFANMVGGLVARHGVAPFGIGSDLCQGRPDSAVTWMRTGRWTRDTSEARFPPQPAWFQSNRDSHGLADGFAAAGFSARERDALLGANWYRFLEKALESHP